MTKEPPEWFVDYHRQLYKLKPCPLCAGSGMLMTDPKHNIFFIACQTCGTVTSGFIDKQKAVDLWNSRPQPLPKVVENQSRDAKGKKMSKRVSLHQLYGMARDQILDLLLEGATLRKPVIIDPLVKVELDGQAYYVATFGIPKALGAVRGNGFYEWRLLLRKAPKKRMSKTCLKTSNRTRTRAAVAKAKPEGQTPP